MTTQRKSLSPDARWGVLAAGGFRCVYCGRRPPEAVLKVDHIVALANGGLNEPNNYAVACSTCNEGKGAKTLPPAPRWLPTPAHPLRCVDGCPAWAERAGALVCVVCRFAVATRAA